MVCTLGCQVQGVPAFGDTVGAGYTPLPCRKCPVLSIWGWIFPPKPVQEHLLRRRITSPKNKTPQGRRGCSSKEQGGDDPPPPPPPGLPGTKSIALPTLTSSTAAPASASLPPSDEGGGPSPPKLGTGGVRPTPPRHPRSARHRCRPARAWPRSGCHWAGGAGVVPGGDAGPGGLVGAGPAGWGYARGACPACGPAGDEPWAAASACRWRARARVSSGTAGAWGRCWPWVPVGSDPPLPAPPPPPQPGGWWAAGRLAGVFWGPSSPAPRGAGVASHGRAPLPPCRSRGAARVPSIPGDPPSLRWGHRLPPVCPLAPQVPQHPQPLNLGLGGTAGFPGDPRQHRRPCTQLQNEPEGWGAGRPPGWL